MKIRSRGTGLAGAALLLLLTAHSPGSPTSTATAPPGSSAPELIVLVRHAEKAPEPAGDPPLSADGTRRAVDLARALADAGITRIHSSDTRRTRDTAAPLARALGLEVEFYDPQELGGLAGRLRGEPGRHLVVGHSNTTDPLSVALGGASHGEIAESWEYDRLYLLVPAGGTGGDGMSTTLLRFGAPARP